MNLTVEIKFEGNAFDNAIDGTTPEGIRLRNILCDLIKQNCSERVLNCTVIEVTKKANSVIVKYELAVNAISKEQAQEVIDCIQNQVNTGMIGNYKVDPNHPIEPTTTPPTTQPTPDQVVTTKQSRIDTEMRLTSVVFDEVKDLTSNAGKQFKTDFEKNMKKVMKEKNKLVTDVKVTGVRNGSVIVEYYLVLNTTSEDEAAKIANAVTEVIKSGKIGNYTTDPTFKHDAYIIRKVKASDVSTASDKTTTTVSTALLIILGVALFILLLIIIVLVVLVFCLLKLKRKGDKQ
ncbi:uncharacterized protein LOC116299097 [Actinia tenebrosa]|uniref:Uncharacterized protein LOC116299097 n=1 Tax=Actinia tenebrosa TaxID=6105 RepID=A0A6P8ICP7_ACTTE|nr:uncharacterized protein LOC116299097 [Actinia tenebrosa]